MSSTDWPIRVGLIGCGNVALGDHVPAYLSMPDRYRLVAIADPTPPGSSSAGPPAGSTRQIATPMRLRSSPEPIST